MLILQHGNCEWCQKPFGQMDAVQTTNVVCKKCKKEYILCRACKAKGCQCKGKLENSFDRFPHLLH